ncbi:hypothetical protein CQJ94_26930 [Glycomyces fuscus]|nr:hypothetical protein CQJ94_26930 [Glycomyces fuscus]
MRAFTRITAATVLAAGLAVTGAGTALAAAPAQEDPRSEGLLGLILGGFFEEDNDTAPPVNSGTQESPAAPAEQAPDTGGATGAM